METMDLLKHDTIVKAMTEILMERPFYNFETIVKEIQNKYPDHWFSKTNPLLELFLITEPICSATNSRYIR